MGHPALQVQGGGLEVGGVAMAEGGVHAVVVLGRDHFQGILAPQRSVAVARFDGRRVVQLFGAEIALADRRCRSRRRRRAGTASGRRRRTKCSRSSSSSVMPLQEGMAGIEQGADHVVFGIARSTGRRSPCARPEGGRFPHWAWLRRARAGRAARAGDSSGRRRLEIGVLQEGGGGQEDIGVIGGIGLELFEDDGEEVVAAEAARGRRSGRARWRRDWSCRPPAP